ncbi:hypothetical protein D623_10006871 [Myotis brandtii]|uniref:Uncharacterized protein n=1 Tax=Myotis brandtii TaxID=109478 RepID=S7MV79_MYOBR|nr:hypothetical protein D623_10006871 [Myotis brandtii]
MLRPGFTGQGAMLGNSWVERCSDLSRCPPPRRTPTPLRPPFTPPRRRVGPAYRPRGSSPAAAPPLQLLRRKTRARSCQVVYTVAMATGRFRRSRKY